MAHRHAHSLVHSQRQAALWLAVAQEIALVTALVTACQAPPHQVQQAPDSAPADARPIPRDSSVPAAVDALAADAAAASDAGGIASDAAPVDARPPEMYCGPWAGRPCVSCGTINCSGSARNLFCELSGPPCPMFEISTTVEWPPGVAPVSAYDGGVAFGDIDGDQQVDAVVSAPDRVRVLRGDGLGNFTIATSALPGAGPSVVRGVTLVDYDGDGDLDLALTAEQPNAGLYLFGNDGTGHFFDETGKLGGVDVQLPGGPAWGDYDGDGYLDVFVPAYANHPSRLFRNQGGASFEEVGAAMGVANPPAMSLQGLWLDYDDDGDQDLLAVNDRGVVSGIPSVLYRNDGGSTFTDVGASAGITDLVEAMGVAAGDLDHDGDLDLYITDVGWQAPDGQLLYINQGDGTFVEDAGNWVAEADDYLGWGVEFVDFDNDGDLDIALASQYPQQPWLGLNLGTRFMDIAPAVTGYPQERQFGMASADFDRDGRVDFGWRVRKLDTVNDPGALARFTRNIMPNTGHWLRVELAGRAPNTRAIGAVIRVRAGLITRTRLITAGSSFLSSSEPVAHFGLGGVTSVQTIEVRWPDGVTVQYPGPWAVDQTLVLSPP